MRDNTETKVTEYPKCDFCPGEAHYDGRTFFGPWASMCEKCFRFSGIGLGLGRGQRLILDKEVIV